MQVERLAIPEVALVTPRRFSDSRGYFAETWNKAALAKHGIDVDFVQDNHSYSAARLSDKDAVLPRLAECPAWFAA